MTAQAMMERFELPEELALRLPILASLLNGRDQVLAEGFSYERLLLEMSQAITSSGVQSSVPQAESSGQYWIHPEAIINEEVTIEGPCIVCRGAEVGPQAFLGAGTVVGPFAKLGYGVVVKASIIGANSKIKYRTSIANSIIGEAADISETVAVASPPNRRSPVRSWTSSGQPLETDLSALGSQIGTQAEIGEGSLILPGSVICDDVKVRNSTINGYINSLHVPPKETPSEEKNGESLWLPSFFPDEHRKGPAVISNKVLLAAVVVLAILMAGLLGLAFFSLSRVDSVATLPLPASEPSAPTGPPPMEPSAELALEPPQGIVPNQPAPVESSSLEQPANTVAQPIQELPAPLPSTLPPTPAGIAPQQPAASPSALIPLTPGGYTLQVGSFKTTARAQLLEGLLQARGFSPYVVEAEIPGSGRYYRVRVGKLSTAEEALSLARELQAKLGRELGTEPWLVPYGPSQEP